jgi:di/tricarboxylate transporter
MTRLPAVSPRFADLPVLRSQSRFADVAVSHWPVFALLTGVLAVITAIVLFRGRPTGDGSVAIAEVVGWSTVLVLPPVIYVAMLAAGFSAQSSIFAAMLGATVVFWVFGLVDEFVPALVAVVATLIIGLAPPDVALAGFSSPSLLLLLGVYALSAVISSSGLSYRLILGLLVRLPDKPVWHQVTLLGSGYLLSPLMPSTNARLSLLTPVHKDMAAGLNLPPRGPAITALLAAMFGGAALFSPMMATSKSANIAALGLLPPQVQAEFGGLFWLVAAAVAAVGVTVIHLLVLPRLFPTGAEGPLPREDIRRRLADMGPLNPQEWVAAGGFLFFLIGSATVSWHHVKPPYLAGCVLLALLLTGTLVRKDFQRQIDWPMIFFLLGIDSLMRIMGHLGLAESLARAVGHTFDFVNGRIVLFILVALVVTLTVRLALPVTAGMLTAAVVLLPVAAAQGIHPWICVFCAAVFSDISFFRHQGTNGLIQIRSDGLLTQADERGFTRYNMLMNAARVLVVFASIPWWKWLGLL